MLVVRYLDADMHETALTAASVDTVGAGPGDTVLLCSSSSARATVATEGTCTDLAIVGIVT
jgi:microcompartment protein CcmK/EutM